MKKLLLIIILALSTPLLAKDRAKGVRVFTDVEIKEFRKESFTTGCIAGAITMVMAFEKRDLFPKELESVLTGCQMLEKKFKQNKVQL